MTKIYVFILAFCCILMSSCDAEEASANDCYTCDNCTEFPNILNGREYCVDGFDNRSDWETNKSAQENESGCTCE